tara:strand:+ start:58 stop:693 length:636 start_codon:yes stop_codon:yes gene_type:complete
MRLLISIISKVSFLFGLFIGKLVSKKLIYFINQIRRQFITGFYKSSFKFFGSSSLVGINSTFINLNYITFGNNSSIGSNTTLSCYAEKKSNIKPEMIIGNGVSIGSDSHITCANRIIIGNNVLTGKRLLITDNAHGSSNKNILNIPPLKREIISKGPVIIEDNVWIGEKVSIMPNLKIGKGAIIAANSVVTKNIPAYSVAAGVPAKIIKQQ